MRDILSISMFSWVDKNDLLVVNSEFGVLKKTTDLSTRDYLQLTKINPNKLSIKYFLISLGNQGILE